jgi:sulfonate transport system substrate-binding protein
MKRQFLKTIFGLLFGLSVLSLPATANAEYNSRELRIGYHKLANLLGLLKADGTLEKRFAAQGIAVKWIEFPAGPQLLEALNVGAVDFGTTGDTPPIFAQAAGARFVYAACNITGPKLQALIVPQNSPIKSVSELKGKKVLVNKGSSTHYQLIKTLETHGIKYSEITPVFLPPADSGAAFERGSVDAWLTWFPYLALQQKAGARVLADGTGIVESRTFYLAEREFATKRPDLLRQLVEALQEQGQWVEKNYASAAAKLAPLQGVETALIEQMLRDADHRVKPVSEAVIESQQRLGDVFFDLKLIPKRIKVKEAAPIGV